MFWGYRATAAGEVGETPDLPFLSSEREGSR
jgi:hypothetical protein